ncbi:ROK family protein [Streptomyces sp. NPDC059499]|uniref:ROK family protein n=1 Tax=Streptomyces sp. NPDC059499 TaxID=3346852 RepID=UPI0036CE65FE
MGIDVGGTKVALRIEGDGARAVGSVFRWPPVSPSAPHRSATERDLASLARHVGLLRAEWGGPVRSVGVAMPATVDGEGRVLTWPGRPHWTGLGLHEELRGLIPGAAVRFADDGDLAALAEAGRAGCRNLVYLGVGTGIGGGVVVDGRTVPGPGRGSCEVGHIVVDRAGPRCDCGRHGCVQALASGPATLRRAATLLGGPVDFDALRNGFAAGAGWAVSAVQESGEALATAAVSLCELTHPERVLIGGGFASGLPGLVTVVTEHTRRLARPGVPPVPVGEAALGGLSSLYGAVSLARGR